MIQNYSRLSTCSLQEIKLDRTHTSPADFQEVMTTWREKYWTGQGWGKWSSCNHYFSRAGEGHVKPDHVIMWFNLYLILLYYSIHYTMNFTQLLFTYENITNIGWHVTWIGRIPQSSQPELLLYTESHCSNLLSEYWSLLLTTSIIHCF